MIAYNFQSFSLPVFLTQAQRIVTAMTGNPQFPEPWSSTVPPLAQITADLATFSSVYAATSGGDKGRIAERSKARAALADDLRQLGLFVEMMANGDASLLATTGFDLTSRRAPAMVQLPLPSPQNLRLKRGEVSGLLVARVAKLAAAGAYEVQLTASDPTVEANWSNAGTFTQCRRIELPDLTPLKTYSVRVRGISSAGPGAWTLPSSLTVL
jgi:hypothetical protein